MVYGLPAAPPVAGLKVFPVTPVPLHVPPATVAVNATAPADSQT